jgi:two-component system sensor histidine kinase CpxA
VRLILRNPLRSLYAKIFLWFCVTIVVTLTTTLVAASVTGSQPFGRRWMGITQDLYARSAVDFYRSGGAPALRHYLDILAANSGIHGQLVDASGHDVLGDPLAPETSAVLAQARRTGLSGFHLGRIWTAATPVGDHGTHFIFLMAVHPLRPFLDGTFAIEMLPRLSLGILLVALFCLLLARHITRPIRILEDAATQLASGSLGVRAGPRIARRRDELARMAAAFDRMAERIQNLLVTQQEMLGHVSHELRSPLTRIGVSLELIRRGETESGGMQTTERMQLELDRLNQMIGEILELTRMDLQTLQDGSALNRFPVDLAPLLQAVADDAVFEAGPERKIVCETADGCEVYGDSTLLRRCFENIVRNALVYTPANSIIRIAVTRDETGHAAVILIQDSGPGVPSESLPRLFELFYRAPSTAPQQPEGTGFGLAIAQRIVALHGGVISARNLEPHGLELRIVFILVDRT